jgi:hypothetical protein
MSRRLLQIAVGVASAQALIGGGLYLGFGVAGLSVVTGSSLPIAPSDPTWAVVDCVFRALAGI